MIDWTRVKGFEWDAGNERKSVEKHGVDQFEAEQVFFSEPLLIAPDPSHSQRESRWHALGRTLDGRHLHVTFTLRQDGTLIRVISARPMHRKEKAHYVKATQTSP
ncbi:MAG: BrnT family toxin [Rhodovibrio sp.]|nr:BrnT family toxin [Rhodovibrio sp.]